MYQSVQSVTTHTLWMPDAHKKPVLLYYSLANTVNVHFCLKPLCDKKTLCNKDTYTYEPYALHTFVLTSTDRVTIMKVC